VSDGVDRGEQNQQRRDQHRLWMIEDPVQQGLIDVNEAAVDGVAVLARDSATDQITHQDGDEGDGKPRGGGHRVGLGEGERCEQPSLLSLQGKDRNKRQGDDQ